MVIGLEDVISKGFVGISVVLYDSVVFEHSKLVSHELEVRVDFVEVSSSAIKQIFVALNEVMTLLEHGSEHIECAV